MKNKNKVRIYVGNKKVVDLVQSSKKGSKTNRIGVQDFIEYIRSKDAQSGRYQLKAKSLEELQNCFFSYYKVLKAGGGVVVNHKNEILLIFRRGFWDLPKGKMDKGETIEQTSIREVEEETGLKKVTITKPVELKLNDTHITYHTYTQNNKHLIKASYWYIMKTNKQTLVPQTEEDIEQAIWVPMNEVKNYYKNAYPAIVDVLKGALKQLKQ